MASYILPNVCRRGILAQNNINASLTAAKLFSSIDDEANGLVVRTHSTNNQSVFVGSSSVTTTGANRGFELAAGDDLGVAIAGPASDEFYQISTDATDDILVMQIG